MIILVGNRMCPLGLEEREAGIFWNLTWLYLPYMLAGRGGSVRHEKMDWGYNMPD